MATKRKGTMQRIVDTISELVRQPLSDESYEVPTAAAVKRSQSVAAGPKARKSKVKKAAARSGEPAARRKSAARKKKR